jgi:alanine dehydrogenase
VIEGNMLLLTREDVVALLTMEECIAAVEHAFRLHGEKRAAAPAMLGLHAENGAFHIKAGFLNRTRTYFAAKVNANYPENGVRFGLPTIQGVIVLCDAENGRPLALMDSMEVTAQRTAAATAVAAKYLARPESATLTLCGCGVQARSQLRALATVLPLRRALVYDVVAERASRFAKQMTAELAIEIQRVTDVGAAIQQSDVCASCTTSRRAFLKKQDVPPGLFLAAVGADHPEKQELDPALMAASTVVTDVTEQCASIGDLHHAIAAGTMQPADVHAELGEVVAGHKPGRQAREEIIIFDSTGMALQDVAAAAVVYEKALATRRGTAIHLAA